MVEIIKKPRHVELCEASPDVRDDVSSTQDGVRSLSILQRFIYILIRSYQLIIAPILPKTCRFYPSCSEYGLAAIEHYGPVKGSLKTMARLSRCHPWSAGGYDPILPNKEKR